MNKNIIRLIVFIVIGIATVFFKLPSSFAQNPLPLKEILEHPQLFDSKTVIVEGEVVGEILKDKGGGVWINVLDGGYNLGVYARDRNLLKNIKYFGAYRVQGDIIRVRGVFYKDCPVHAERDIHLLSVEIIKRGRRLKDAPSRFKKEVSFVLAIMCLTLVIIYFIRLRYARRY